MWQVVAAAAVGGALFGGFKGNQRQDMANRRMATAIKESNKVERRRAEIENARNIEILANKNRAAAANNIAAAASSGASSSSSVFGANNALLSSVFGEEGNMNTQLAANSLKAHYMQKGNSQYNTLMNQANNWNALSQLSGQAAMSTIGMFA